MINGETGEYMCAGTIISARFVLTVAHCVQRLQKSLLMVRVGDWDLQTTREMLPSYDVEGNSHSNIGSLIISFELVIEIDGTRWYGN